MTRPDDFDRIFGADTVLAEAYRNRYAKRWPDNRALYVAIADILNDMTAWEYVRLDHDPPRPRANEKLYPRADVQAFVTAWAEVDFSGDIRWTLHKWHGGDQPIAPVIEAMPAACHLLDIGETVSAVATAWNEGGFWAMVAVARGIHPELAEVLG